ncbi:TetR/AcrR family transcriptional regulator [Nocardia lijiangensis]|uniref:TetR/AcrR family transcriptional regulator n=1 Tax=Nocardia lijiangensis TaxID=299618 RepID=UPI003D73F2E2
MSDRQTQILQAAVRVIARDGVRGLRVDKLAAEARVSTALVYYHFKDRAGILRAALDHVNRRAQRYTDDAFAHSDDPRVRVEQLLLLELQDDDEVRENSVAWGELRASATFDTTLREPLRATTLAWNSDVETLIAQARDAGAVRRGIDAAVAAEHLTTLVEGLSERWHSGSITLDRARQILADAIERQLGGPA